MADERFKKKANKADALFTSFTGIRNSEELTGVKVSKNNWLRGGTGKDGSLLVTNEGQRSVAGSGKKRPVLTETCKNVSLFHKS